MSSSPALIVVDWGSSSFRAFLMANDGTVIDEYKNNCGAFQISNYEETLREACKKWITKHGTLPIRMGGSIGSRNGWQETGYVECPVAPTDLKSAAVAVKNSMRWDIAVMPGVCIRAGVGECDVMRGEEIQIFGALQIMDVSSGLFCLPGTHSKWCRVEHGRIMSIDSYLSGELFALVTQNGSLSTIIEGTDYDEQAFLEGLDAIGRQPNLLKLLFKARAGVLLDQYPGSRLAPFLSGVLIGYEVRNAINSVSSDDTVTIVASPELMARYELVFREFGRSTRAVAGEDAFIKGMKLLVG